MTEQTPSPVVLLRRIGQQLVFIIDGKNGEQFLMARITVGQIREVEIGKSSTLSVSLECTVPRNVTVLRSELYDQQPG